MERSIIAMKGPPFTRKTEYATFIAASLKCPLLSIDDFLDVLCPEYLQTCCSSNTSTTPSPHPQDLAFQIICRITASHLSERIFDKVVIDSSLSSRSHLNQLMELANSFSKTRLVIVECKPDNKYAWETEFQKFKDLNRVDTQKWYKAKNLHDIEKAVREDYDVEKAIQEDYDETYHGYKFSKLVLDPLSDPQKYEVVTLLLSTDRKSLKSSSFVEAVKYMISRIEDDSTGHIVHFDKWKQSRQLHYRALNREDNDGSGSGQFSDTQQRPQLYCRDGHNIIKYTEAGLGYKAKCMACGNQVTAQAYSCNNCSSALHKDCAESSFTKIKRGTPKQGTTACASCKEEGKSFSKSCLSCLFEDDVRCLMGPIIIRHECEEHFLVKEVQQQNDLKTVYRCAACGKFGRRDPFSCLYSCTICGVTYHYTCLQRPSQVEHVHGGHHHHMQLHFSSEEAEDYMCDECVGEGRPFRRNPKLWFYSCQECSYEVHLDCVVRRLFKQKGISKSRIAI